MATSEERTARDHQKQLSAWDVQTARNELYGANQNYDRADERSDALTLHEIQQARRKAEADRFGQSRKLQNSAVGLLGEMGPALNGSALGNLLRMLGIQSDTDNRTYWDQYEQDRDQIQNENEATKNQNAALRDEAALNAETRIRDILSNEAANIANISQDLFESPSKLATGASNPNGVYNAGRAAARNIPMSGYIMPEDAEQDARALTPRNRLQRNDYFSRLMNGFNGR